MLRYILGAIAALTATQNVLADTFYTKRCAAHGHPEFQITVSEKSIPSVDIEWLLRTLEGMVAAGQRFRPGETVQLGWMINELQIGADGVLKVMEPDMRAVPIKFVDSVDATLRQLRAQKDSVESVLPTDELTFPSLGQSVVVHQNYKTSLRVLLDRAVAKDPDSGWWLSDLDDQAGAQDPKRFTKISLYQLAIDRPDLIKFFSFPAGVQVVLDHKIGVLKDGQELAIKPESFLDQLNRNRRPGSAATSD